MKECKTCIHEDVCEKAKHVENYRVQGCEHHKDKPEWISVEKGLPENDYEKHWKDRAYYLVRLAPNGLMRVARFGYKQYSWWIDSHNCVLDTTRSGKVTHWMPLPPTEILKGGASE